MFSMLKLDELLVNIISIQYCRPVTNFYIKYDWYQISMQIEMLNVKYHFEQLCIAFHQMCHVHFADASENSTLFIIVLDTSCNNYKTVIKVIL